MRPKPNGKGGESPKTTGNIIQWTDMDLERVLRAMDNRSQWRRMIHGAVNPRIEDD